MDRRGHSVGTVLIANRTGPGAARSSVRPLDLAHSQGCTIVVGASAPNACGCGHDPLRQGPGPCGVRAWVPGGGAGIALP